MKKYILPIVLAVALLITAGWGYFQYQEKNNYYIYLENQYQRLYYDLTGSVETITTDLSKLMVSSPQKKENLILYSNIWQNAYNAQEKLSQLPIRHTEINKVQKFLNQLGDYTFAMAQRTVQGEVLQDKERGNLEKLHNYALELSLNLRELHEKALKDVIWKDELKKKANAKLNQDAAKENPIQLKFNQFEERMVEYPELIYDGPFSEHVAEGVHPRLQGNKVSRETAEKKVKEFLGNAKIERVESMTNGRGRVDTYSFEAIPANQGKGKGNPVYIDISQIKGYVAWILNNRDIEKPKLSQKQAIQRASKFLEEKGYKNMISTYTLRYGDAILINYAYKQDDIIMYPDLIKIKVALDNGEIVGFDATQFLTNNYKRPIEKPLLTPEQAREKVGSQAQINGTPRLCYIPTKSLNEIYCYEFKATYKGDLFLIYINADTGEEEKILKLIQNKNGTLTI